MDDVERANEQTIMKYRIALNCLADIPPKTVQDVRTGTTASPNPLRGCGFVTTAIDNVWDY